LNIREFLLILRHRLLQPLELGLLLFSFVLAIILFWLLDAISQLKPFYLLFVPYFPLSTTIIKFITWLVIFHLVKKGVNKVEEFRRRGKSYAFNNKNWEREWIFNGQSYTLPDPSRIVIYSSRAGCLLEKYVWKDFVMSFEMKLLENSPQKNMGIIFRAKDLENYFMLEIFLRDNENKIYVKPHVRSQGAWEFIQETFVGNFDLLQFQKVKLRVDNVRVHFYISGNKVFEWYLPTHLDINHIEAGVQGSSDETTSRGIIPRIDFRNRYGKIGFRAYPGQGAECKNLNIKSLKHSFES